jgi:asparagine synthase (glutamine-hydrolysing)
LKERRTKLIINGDRVFDFAGLSWWIPLEDKELYEFWKKVPMEQKRHRSFYEDYIETLYSEEANVSEKHAAEIADTTYKSIVADMVRNYPIWPLIKRLYDMWTKSRVRYMCMNNFEIGNIYNNDVRFGIMNKQQLKDLYKGQNYLFFSLLARITTGKITIEE